jgi:alpha-1,6-mannosyltransferase
MRNLELGLASSKGEDMMKLFGEDILFILQLPIYAERNDADAVLDFFLTLLIPSLILVHLLVAPYTKVEESFNLQATRDILVYSTPTHDIGARLRANYDHFEFPGAVPRTFVGAAALAGVSRPILQVVGWQHGQLVVRAVLGLFNAFALLRYKNGVEKAFGKAAGRWYILLQASQFHVIYYASRTLPNMFAFGLSKTHYLAVTVRAERDEQLLKNPRHIGTTRTASYAHIIFQRTYRHRYEAP